MNSNIAANEVQDWDLVIGKQGKVFNLNLKDLWRYRDLLLMFVKKDIITVYKQTILGPIWFVAQPLLTTLIFVLIFGRMAKLGTDGIPPNLFYLGSISLWNYFADTLNVTSKTFTDNASIFGKVYFPRLIIPMSKIISGLVKFLIQFSLFIVALLYYVFISKNHVTPNVYMLLFPILLAIMAFMSLGVGIIVTSLTTKYRDLTFLIAFGIQLFMYATPVILPASKYREHHIPIFLNPLTSIFETFKYGFLGHGEFSWFWLGYTLLFTIVVMVIGLIVFNKIEKRFIDTV